VNLEMFVTWIVIGLLTGWLLGFVLKHGGYGRISDTAGAAFVGAALITVLQRKIWPSRTLRNVRTTDG
jgi:uncharacterized membrane protein YeaQ/YmgE (transglycosylase-associated protein family)